MFERGLDRNTNKNFSINRLHKLVLVKKAGYILKASGSNSTEASLISRQIGELENFLGKVSLRKKKGKLTGLSPEGEKLANITENFLSNLQDFLDELDDIPPSIAIGAGDTFLSSILLPNFSELKESAKELRLNLCNMRSADLPNALDAGEVDLIVVSEDKIAKNTQRYSLGKLEYKLYAPLHWKNLTKYRSSPLEMICHEPYASLSGSGDRRKFVEDATNKIGKKPNYELECSSHLEVLQAVKSKCFCGILPTFLSKDLPINYFKHITVKELAEMHGKLVIAWKKETYHYKPEIKTVAKEIQNIFKKAVIPPK